MSDSETLTLALLLDGPMVDRWEAEAIEYLLANTGVEVSLVVFNEDPFSFTGHSLDYYLRKLRTRTGWIPILAARMLHNELLGPRPHREKRHISTIKGLGNPRQIGCEPIPQDVGVEIPAETAQQVGDAADVALLFGFGIIKGPILEAPEKGVISFHHGDIREYRGRPVGFWEFLHGESSVGVTLQQLTAELDGGRIVSFGTVDIERTDTWQDIKRKLYGEITRELLVEGVRNLSDPTFESTEPDSLGDLYTSPEPPATIKYFVMNTHRRLRKLAQRI